MNNKKISLILGSGGARGYAHTGVIEEMIGNVMIEDLPIQFTAVATDLIKQKEIWIQKGRLIDAIRASVAIPTFLTPKKIGERYLIDGGVLNPLPIAPTVADDTDITIAVNLSANVLKEYKVPMPAKVREKTSGMEEIFFEMSQKAEQLFSREKKNTFDKMGMFDIMGRTIDIMQNAVLDCKMAGYSPDIIIGIPNNACGFYEFNRAYEMIELGKIITKEHLGEKV